MTHTKDNIKAVARLVEKYILSKLGITVTGLTAISKIAAELLSLIASVAPAFEGLAPIFELVSGLTDTFSKVADLASSLAAAAFKKYGTFYMDINLLGQVTTGNL